MQSGNVEALIVKRFGKFKKVQGRKGTDYIVKCFNCGRPKLYITPEQNIFHCFRCGKVGSVTFLFGPGTTTQRHTEIKRIQPLGQNVRSPGDLVELQALHNDHPAILYIRRRKYDYRELNDVFGVRYCNAGQLFGGGIFNTTNTLVFPIFMSGTMVGWQSRLLYTPDELTDDECLLVGLMKDEDGDWVRPPKYFTSPGLEKGQVLFNYDNARQSEVVVITEGPFDAIGVGPSAVATLGKGVTDQQANLVKQYWKLAVIMLDPGDADNEMFELETKLQRSIPTVRVNLAGYKDPGEAPRDAIWQQIGETAYNLGIDILRYKIRL